MANYQFVAATGCPTGIAHTYMAEEKLNQAKIDSMKSLEEQDELYKQAIAAMMDYSGSGEVGDDYDED